MTSTTNAIKCPHCEYVTNDEEKVARCERGDTLNCGVCQKRFVVVETITKKQITTQSHVNLILDQLRHKVLMLNNKGLSSLDKDSTRVFLTELQEELVKQLALENVPYRAAEKESEGLL